jgi:hypothetical protein
MKRVFALLGFVIAVLVGTGVAVAGDAKGPPCSDINFTDNDVSRTDHTTTLTLFTPKASCSSVTYRLVVLDNAGDPDSAPLTTSPPVPGDDFTDRSDGMDIIVLQATDTATDGDVCVFATSSSSRGRVIDRAPDATATPTNCVKLTQGSPGGGGGYN